MSDGMKFHIDFDAWLVGSGYLLVWSFDQTSFTEDLANEPGSGVDTVPVRPVGNL